jgi:hypothetical protein
MWRVERLEMAERTMDFSSSDQGHVAVTSVVADGAILINAVSLIDLSNPNRVQAHVCEACGITHCEPGGWIAFRRLGDEVLWVPCFDAMAADDFGAREYRPPSSWPSWPVFDARLYSEARALIPELPEPAAIPALGSRTAIRLLQFDAPGRALGRFPDPPSLRRELIVASSSGEIPDRVASLEAVIAEAWTNDSPVIAADAPEPVVLYLDLPGTPEWCPLASEPGVFGISSRGGPFVTCKAGSA